MTSLKCCKCGKRTRKFTQVCQNCDHRFCQLCKGGKGNSERHFGIKLDANSRATRKFVRHSCQEQSLIRVL